MISKENRKSIWQNPTPIHDVETTEQKAQQTGYERNPFNVIKGVCEKLRANLIRHVGRLFSS